MPMHGLTVFLGYPASTAAHIKIAAAQICGETSKPCSRDRKGVPYWWLATLALKQLILKSIVHDLNILHNAWLSFPFYVILLQYFGGGIISQIFRTTEWLPFRVQILLIPKYFSIRVYIVS